MGTRLLKNLFAPQLFKTRLPPINFDYGRVRIASYGTGTTPGYQVETNKNIRTIWFDNLKMRNAMTKEMYLGIADTLNETAKEESILLCVLRGKGDIFCAGADLSNLDKSSNMTFREYIASFINFPKPIVAAVNGPAIGIGTTILALCDVVYAVETATFVTPFSTLGLCPEACSSYTFPKIMGKAKAYEILMLGKKITAIEAKDSYNLVTEVFTADSFENEVSKRIADFTKLSQLSINYSKELIHGPDKEILHQTSNRELEKVQICKNSDYSKNAQQAFMQKKKK